MPPSKGETLRVHLDLMTHLLDAAGEPMLHARDLSKIVRDHMIFCHQLTRASVPLMEAARAQALLRQGIAYRVLAAYLQEHIEEERGHDEWALDDLQALGVPRDITQSSIPSAAVAALAGAQYYWILHDDPIALVGYMMTLEHNAPSPNLVAILRDRTNLPASAFRTYLAHAQLDPGHVDRLVELVDRMQLTARQFELVLASAAHTAQSLARCVSALLAGRLVADPRLDAPSPRRH
jgi:hypothetical protein